MAGAAAAVVCTVLGWSALGGGVRLAEARCGDSSAWLVEADLAAGARFAAAAHGRSRTTAEFALESGAVAAVNGGLFDARERPMGPSRSGGRDWPLSPRVTSAGVFGFGDGRAEIAARLQPWMTDAVSGWPMLVRGGKACGGRCGCPRRESLCTDRAARTTVALISGRVLIAVVAAPGVTLAELASWLASLGARSALNLDGGGSTSLVVSGRALTGATLRVPTHLGVVVR